MLFSILIPAYNAEEYIEQCLKSILAQTVTDYEIILCDDASSDNTLQICKKLQARYPNIVHVISHKVNRGLLLTRRDLFAAMRGEYAICVDADDWLAPNALELLKNAIEQSNADLILYELVCKHLDGKEERFVSELEDRHLYFGEDKRIIYQKLLTTYVINSMCTKAVKRDLIDFVDYTPWSRLSNGEDLFQSFPIIDKAEKILFIEEPLYYYRKTAGSISTAIKPNLYDMWEILWEREDFYIGKWNIAEEIRKKKIIARINEMVLIMRSKHGKERKAFYDRIRSDGRLKAYLGIIPRNALRVRYGIICKMVLKKLDCIANGVMWLENRLLRIRK